MCAGIPKPTVLIASGVPGGSIAIVENGALVIDDSIHALPVTLRQALNHTSGLADRGDPRCTQNVEAWFADSLVTRVAVAKRT